jgi:hypothetical protein
MRVASLVQLVAMLTAVAAQAQTPATPPASPCATGAYREFDFWAGEWIVRAASGEEVGRNSVQPDQQGCALIERWTARDGTTGISINFYDPVLRVWTQQWVSPGTVLTMTGGFKDGAMVLEGPLHYLKKGVATRLRGTWTVLPDGRIRQQFVESRDDGKTWKDWFDGYYTRI